MRHNLDRTPVDVDIVVRGNTAYAVDVFPGGERSCLRQRLGTYESPEHAMIMGEILSNPVYLVYLSNGKLTQEKVDQMAAELRKRRVPGSASTTPEGTTQWEYAPIVSAAAPSET